MATIANTAAAIEGATLATTADLPSNMVGDSGSGGTAGLVPAPAAGDAAAGKYLKADGTYSVPPGTSSGAPTDAQYITLATNGTLTNERVLTAGANITLTDGGAGSTLTIAASGGSSAWTLLDTQTASTSASLNFSNKLSATYDNYVVIMDNLLPATWAVDLLMRVGTGAGPSWDSASNYSFAVASVIQSSSDSNDGNSSTTQFRLIQAMSNDATAGGISGILWFFGANSSVYKHAGWQISGMTDAGGFRASNGGGYHKNATVSTSLQLYMSSGNITSGTARLYGITQ